MNIEDQTTSLELSKKLKELGVIKDSYFAWFFLAHEDKFEISIQTKSRVGIPAYSVAELLEILPADINGCHLFIKKSTPSISMTNQYTAAYAGEGIVGIVGNRDPNPANALANLLIFLIENKLAEVKNETT